MSAFSDHLKQRGAYRIQVIVLYLHPSLETFRLTLIPLQLMPCPGSAGRSASAVVHAPELQL